MRKRILSVVILLLAATLFPTRPVIQRASATSNPTVFTLRADINGWNSSTSGGPALNEFRGVFFTANIVWVNFAHDFAIYTKGFSSELVGPSNACSPLTMNGCLARSTTVSSSSQTTPLSFNPKIPSDDFTGPGTYEYFCEFHPNSMHGLITVYKSPDIVNRGRVDIIDAATLAFSFDATPTNSSWNVAADLDNSGKIDILDAALLAFYFDQPF